MSLPYSVRWCWGNLHARIARRVATLMCAIIAIGAAVIAADVAVEDWLENRPGSLIGATVTVTVLLGLSVWRISVGHGPRTTASGSESWINRDVVALGIIAGAIGAAGRQLLCIPLVASVGLIFAAGTVGTPFVVMLARLTYSPVKRTGLMPRFMSSYTFATMNIGFAVSVSGQRLLCATEESQMTGLWGPFFGIWLLGLAWWARKERAALATTVHVPMCIGAFALHWALEGWFDLPALVWILTIWASLRSAQEIATLLLALHPFDHVVETRYTTNVHHALAHRVVLIALNTMLFGTTAGLAVYLATKFLF